MLGTTSATGQKDQAKQQTAQKKKKEKATAPSAANHGGASRVGLYGPTRRPHAVQWKIVNEYDGSEPGSIVFCWNT